MDTPLQFAKQFELIIEWHLYISGHRCIVCLFDYRNIQTGSCCLSSVVVKACCELVHLQIEINLEMRDL